MRNPLALLVLCVFAGWSGGQTVEPPVPPASGEAVTDFGFWAGEWVVQNTRFDAENQVFVDSGTARATVEPVLGGEAYLERWEGDQGPIASTFGLSLRYFDTSVGRWVVWLNWPGGEPRAAGFTRMDGVFEDGMIALHPPRVFAGNFDLEQWISTRFVFSDVGPDSCRWQLQRPGLTERSWMTMWAMEFLRVGEASESPMRLDPVPDECDCKSDESRLTDWMVGEWAGEGVSLRVSSAIRGCGIIASVEVDHEDMRASSILLVSWDARSESWQARELGLNRPLKSLVWQAVGRVSEMGMVLRSVGADDLSGMVLRRLEGDGMQFELTLPDGERLDAELKKL